MFSMFRKMICLVSFVVVLSLVGNVQAAETIWNGNTDGYWLTEGNWEDNLGDPAGVPTTADWVNIYSLPGPIIAGDAVCSDMYIGQDEAHSLPAESGDKAGAMTVDSGTLTVPGWGLYVGSWYEGTLNMNGGTITTSRLGIGYHDTGVGHVQLDGGIINIGIALQMRLQGAAVGTMDITGDGTLIINGDAQSLVQAFIGYGWITAYDGQGTLQLDYDVTNEGKTTLTASPDWNADLVGYWRFDNGSGTIASDSSGTGIDGTLEGDPQWVAGKTGFALELDGDDDYVDCGNSDVFNITQQITLAAWVKLDLNVEMADWCGIIVWAHPDNTTFTLSYDGTSNSIGFKTTGTTPSWMSTAAPGLLDGEWHHVAAVYNGAIKIIYLDSEEIGTTDATGSIETRTTCRLLLGAGRGTDPPTHFFAGMIDEVRVYNRDLTESEILAAMLGRPEFAKDPNPADGAVDVAVDAVLSWALPDPNTTTQPFVYFMEVPSYEITRVALGDPEGFFVPAELKYNTTYMWAVDFGIDGSQPYDTATTKGDTWIFTTMPEPVDSDDVVE